MRVICLILALFVSSVSAVQAGSPPAATMCAALMMNAHEFGRQSDFSHIHTEQAFQDLQDFRRHNLVVSDNEKPPRVVASFHSFTVSSEDGEEAWLRSLQQVRLAERKYEKVRGLVEARSQTFGFVLNDRAEIEAFLRGLEGMTSEIMSGREQDFHETMRSWGWLALTGLAVASPGLADPFRSYPFLAGLFLAWPALSIAFHHYQSTLVDGRPLVDRLRLGLDAVRSNPHAWIHAYLTAGVNPQVADGSFESGSARAIGYVQRRYEEAPFTSNQEKKVVRLNVMLRPIRNDHGVDHPQLIFFGSLKTSPAYDDEDHLVDPSDFRLDHIPGRI